MQFSVLIGLSLLLLLFHYVQGLEFDVPSADRCPPNFVHDEETDACTKTFNGTFDGTLTWLDSALTQLREEKTKLEKLENEESQLQFEDDLHDTKFTARNGVRGRKRLVHKKRRRRNELEVKLKVSILELQIGQVLLERENHVLRSRDEIPISFDNKLEDLEHFKKIFGERNAALTKQIQELIDDRTALNSQLTIMTEKTEEQNLMIKQLEETITTLTTNDQGKKTSKSYHLFKSKVDWRGALRSCREKHMDLATIRSQEDNDAFTELLESEGVNKMESVWIGGTTQKRFDQEWQIGWFWISDGELLDYTNWQEGQPDNYKQYGPESCLSYWRCHGTRNQWEWNDMSCDAKLFYGCESFDPY